MPPKRKNNKQKQIARKKAVTMRLMAISLLVDKYVYKNKQITISQAQIYLEELKSFKSQCLGDAPSLQVCEKLTRCMRGIIDEQQANDAVSEDTDTFIELNHSSNLYAASPVYSLPDEDKTHMGSELIPDLQSETNMFISNNCNDSSKTHDNSKERYDGPSKSVRFFIEDETVNVTPKISTGFDNEDHHNANTNRHCNVEDELTNVIVDLTLQDIERPITIDVDLCSQSILKNSETNETSKTLDDYCMNNTCGQDMVEFDREINKIIEHEDRSCVEYNKDTVAHKITPENPPTTIKKISDIPKTSYIAETRTEFFINPETKKIVKNKSIPEAKINKKRIINVKNKKNKPKTKRRNNKNNSTVTKNDANTKVLIPLAKNSDEALQASKNTGSETYNGSNIGQNADKNIEIDNRLNIVQQHLGTKNSSNIVQNAGSTISNINVSKFVYLEEDLSWVENLKYVREIHLEEYDSTLKPDSESFWDNCDLPDKWDGRDFEYGT